MDVVKHRVVLGHRVPLRGRGRTPTQWISASRPALCERATQRARRSPATCGASRVTCRHDLTTSAPRSSALGQAARDQRARRDLVARAPTRAAMSNVTAAAPNTGPTSGGGLAPRSTRRGYSPDHQIRLLSNINAIPTNRSGENTTVRVARGAGCMPQTYAWIGRWRTGVTPASRAQGLHPGRQARLVRVR